MRYDSHQDATAHKSRKTGRADQGGMRVMTAPDVLIVVAILLGPIVAVGGVRWLDRSRERRDRQLGVFRTLMATRAHTSSPEHIRALNAIDVEFSASKPAEAAVLEAWKRHAGHQASSDLPAEDWDARRRAGLADLLLAMGAVLGYELDREHLLESCAARAPIATATDLL